MRFIEISQGLTMPITNEESDVLAKFDTAQTIFKEDLEPRERLIANQLVNKDILQRTRENGRIYYNKKV